MVRPPLSPQERARGERLGMLLREARGSRSMTEVAAAAGVPVETLRKIETGRIATPAFFTVAALAAAVGVRLEDIVATCAGGETGESLAPGHRKIHAGQALMVSPAPPRGRGRAAATL